MLFRKLYRKSQIFQTNNNFFLHKILKAQEGGTQNKFNFELFGIFAPPPKAKTKFILNSRPPESPSYIKQNFN